MIKQKISKELIRRKPDGLYAWGGPGSGKSFLLDLTYDLLDTQFKMKMHYNEFMFKVHQNIFILAKVLKN